MDTSVLIHVYYLTHMGPRVQYAHMASGLDLKLRRVAADVKATAIADAHEPPVTPSRISYLERIRVVTPEAEAKYLAALDKCVTKSTTAREAA